MKAKAVETFLKAKAREGVSLLTVKRHADNLKYFCRYLGRRRLTRRNIEKFIDYYRKGHKPATVNSAINTIKCFARFLFERKIITKRVTYRLKNLPDDPFTPELLTPNEVRKIIDCPRVWGAYHKWVDRRRYDLYFELLAGCGLRRTEGLSLRVRDFDFINDEFRVLGKGSEVRTIPIPKIIREDLINWIQEKKIKQNYFIFGKKQDQRPTAAAFSDELKKRLEILVLDKSIHLHTFRHTFITEAYRIGLNPIKVMKLVGHTSIKTHLRYMHLIGKDLHDVVDEHPVNKLPESKKLPEKPKLPQFLVEDDFRVN